MGNLIRDPITFVVYNAYMTFCNVPAAIGDKKSFSIFTQNHVKQKSVSELCGFYIHIYLYL